MHCLDCQLIVREVKLFQTSKSTLWRFFGTQPVLPDEPVLVFLVYLNDFSKKVGIIVTHVVCTKIDFFH